MRHTSEPTSAFGLALTSWLVGCAAVAFEARSFRSLLAVRFLCVGLALLGLAAIVLSRRLREERSRADAASTRRNELALELMTTRNKFMHTVESVRIGRAMCPRATDVFVVTYPKCGTTWMTQICHSLRTKGSMDFGEITEVCPWDILAFDCGQDLDADHVAEPRVFKVTRPLLA